MPEPYLFVLVFGKVCGDFRSETGNSKSLTSSTLPSSRFTRSKPTTWTHSSGCCWKSSMRLLSMLVRDEQRKTRAWRRKSVSHTFILNASLRSFSCTPLYAGVREHHQGALAAPLYGRGFGPLTSGTRYALQYFVVNVVLTMLVLHYVNVNLIHFKECKPFEFIRIFL